MVHSVAARNNLYMQNLYRTPSTVAKQQYCRCLETLNTATTPAHCMVSNLGKEALSSPESQAPNVTHLHRSTADLFMDDFCHVTIAVVRMRLAHVLFFGRDSPSVLICSVWFVGYLGDGRVFFFIFLSLSL